VTAEEHRQLNGDESEKEGVEQRQRDRPLGQRESAQRAPISPLPPESRREAEAERSREDERKRRDPAG
jgi:hypothetical protein